MREAKVFSFRQKIVRVEIDFNSLIICISKLKSDSHVPDNLYQIKIFPILVRRSTIICLFGV